MKKLLFVFLLSGCALSPEWKRTLTTMGEHCLASPALSAATDAVAMIFDGLDNGNADYKQIGVTAAEHFGAAAVLCGIEQWHKALGGDMAELPREYLVAGPIPAAKWNARRKAVDRLYHERDWVPPKEKR